MAAALPRSVTGSWRSLRANEQLPTSDHRDRTDRQKAHADDEQGAVVLAGARELLGSGDDIALNVAVHAAGGGVLRARGGLDVVGAAFAAAGLTAPAEVEVAARVLPGR